MKHYDVKVSEIIKAVEEGRVANPTSRFLSQLRSVALAYEKAREPDLVTITCYGQTDTMERRKAIEFYNMCASNSDGCERMRYMNILQGLHNGDKEVDDQ